MLAKLRSMSVIGIDAFEIGIEAYDRHDGLGNPVCYIETMRRVICFLGKNAKEEKSWEHSFPPSLGTAWSRMMPGGRC